ncbi:AAA family ATPase [Pluralibacter gergoviae]|uniref:sigma-54 interaction domain-containing protein n=1 Tax=Pluralibacter gergoviae TaxID=61647 RepID=UPI0004F857E0|nr:sigma-54 dependent transcriptional regulator [Pluralibacter gergoviae]AIQ99824.1 AAA family ATPase [Pluralibacter gergoviae]
MRSVLEFALSLASLEDEASLNDWLLQMLARFWQPKGILLGLLDLSGRQLECYGTVNGRRFSMGLAADDFGHPLAYVIHKNQQRIWNSLLGGARIDHEDFHNLLSGAGADYGLYAMPVKDAQGKSSGVLGILDNAAHFKKWQESNELNLLCRVYEQQLARVRSQRDHTVLRQSLRQIAGENARRQLKKNLLAAQLVGASAVIQTLRDQIAKEAEHCLSVMILGETGTGKDVVARLLHQCSARAEQSFVAINCAAIPENLIESELFGYLKGAFSGANSNKEGLIAQANGGTLFLDEVGDMPMIMQSKLLRVLENHHYRPLGGDKEYFSDFRVIAATHQPLERRVEEGLFRHDLWHRLCQSKIVIPPLRARKDDIALLGQHFIQCFSERDSRAQSPLSADFLTLLMGYHFPGNVRELHNILEVAYAHTASGEVVGTEALSDEMRERLSRAEKPFEDRYNTIDDLREALQLFEAAIIRSRLSLYQGNRTQVAESLNIARRTLDHKCMKLEVE